MVFFFLSSGQRRSRNNTVRSICRWIFFRSFIIFIFFIKSLLCQTCIKRRHPRSAFVLQQTSSLLLQHFNLSECVSFVTSNCMGRAVRQFEKEWSWVEEEKKRASLEDRLVPWVWCAFPLKYSLKYSLTDSSRFERIVKKLVIALRFTKRPQPPLRGPKSSFVSITHGRGLSWSWKLEECFC